MKIRLFLSTTGDLAYSEIPKCACSTVKQYLHAVGRGDFHPGNIHRARDGLLGWKSDRMAIRLRLFLRRHHHFTFVRNPYARLVSAFYDKIANPQEGGEMYGKPDLRAAVADYGIDPAADPLTAFRRFVVLARDTIRFATPVEPDIHWTPMAWHAAAPMRLGFAYDEIFHVETFAADLAGLLRRRLPDRAAEWATIRVFNEGGAGPVERRLSVADHYDATSRLLMQEAYGDDFHCFGYSTDPTRVLAAAPPVAEVNARLARVAARLRAAGSTGRRVEPLPIPIEGARLVPA